VDLDEAFGGLGPVRSGCDCMEAFTGTVWKSEIVNACGTVGVSSPFSDSSKDRVVKREWHDRRSGGWVQWLVRLLPARDPERGRSRSLIPSSRTAEDTSAHVSAYFLPAVATRL
jgi:hypothetical protein